jgi:histidinol-phosphatase
VDPRSWLAFLAEIADATGPLALGHFRSSSLRVDLKPDSSLVTEADLAVEERVRQLVAERHPALGVFGEERGETAGQGSARLIVDPIDSTANFARGIPIFATLLAIEEGGEIVAGLVDAPALALRWSASRGGGAWCGDRRLGVSALDELSQSQVFHGSLAGSEWGRDVPGLRRLLEQSRRQRGFGDFYQHVLVAEGAGEVAVDPMVHPWDVAPLLLLAEEAGGRATSLEGERSIYAGSLVTTNGRLHDEVLAILGGA